MVGRASGMIGDRYRRVRERANQAAVRAGRRPEEVNVIVAAKTFAAEAVLEAIRAGARDIGENYVQEARRKRERLRSLGGDDGVHWHLIGRLQRNKAKQAITFFEIIHSLDGELLARDLDRAAGAAGIRASCLIEVNLGNETTKAGLPEGHVVELFELLAPLPNLVVRGLMAIPPPGSHESNRPHFARLRRLRDRLNDLRLPNAQLKELSMGMSSDFEGAIQEGATMVRVGTEIFGPRSARRG